MRAQLSNLIGSGKRFLERVCRMSRRHSFPKSTFSTSSLLLETGDTAHSIKIFAELPKLFCHLLNFVLGAFMLLVLHQLCIGRCLKCLYVDNNHCTYAQIDRVLR